MILDLLTADAEGIAHSPVRSTGPPQAMLSREGALPIRKPLHTFREARPAA